MTPAPAAVRAPGRPSWPVALAGLGCLLALTPLLLIGGCYVRSYVLVGQVSIEIRPGLSANLVHLGAGDTATFRARAYNSAWPWYLKADSYEDPRRFAWTSSDDQVATVDLRGRVHALRPGVTWVRAAVGGVTSTLPIRVIVSAPGSPRDF